MAFKACRFKKKNCVKMFKHGSLERCSCNIFWALVLQWAMSANAFRILKARILTAIESCQSFEKKNLGRGRRTITAVAS